MAKEIVRTGANGRSSKCTAYGGLGYVSGITTVVLEGGMREQALTSCLPLTVPTKSGFCSPTSPWVPWTITVISTPCGTNGCWTAMNPPAA